MKDFIKKYSEKISVTCIGAVLVVLMYFTIGCPSRFFFGVACPGCGMTRALIALLSLDFEKAHEMHPLIFIMPVVAVLFFFSAKLPKKAANTLAIAFTALMVATFIYRVLAGNEVIYFAPETGAIYIVIQKIFRFITGGI